MDNNSNINITLDKSTGSNVNLEAGRSRVRIIGLGLPSEEMAMNESEPDVSDKRCKMRGVVQLIGLFLILIGCVIGLILTKNTMDLTDIYFGIVMSIIGILLPGPKLK